MLGGVTLVGPAAMDCYLPGLPALADDFGVSASAAQVTITAFLIGLALGQFVTGPLSDVHGRRRPLIGGMALFTVASLLCSLTPDLYTIAAARLVQGLAAASGMAIGRAIVRDLYSGAAAARYLSRLVLIIGLGPILAPLIGAQILRFTSWRGTFAAVALFGLALTFMVARFLPETLPRERRRPAGLGFTVRAFGKLVVERRFLGLALVCGLGAGAMFAYVAGSPFVFQQVYGTSPQLFGLMFGINAVALIVGAQINAHVVMRRGPRRLIGFGLALMVTAGAGLVGAAIFRGAGLASIMVPLSLLMFSWSFVQSNAFALALTDHPRVAGTASALLGVCQYLFGALLSPLVGVGGEETALPFAVVILACGIGASLVFGLVVLRTFRVTVVPSPRTSDA